MLLVVMVQYMAEARRTEPSNHSFWVKVAVAARQTFLPEPVSLLLGSSERLVPYFENGPLSRRFMKVQSSVDYSSYTS